MPALSFPWRRRAKASGKSAWKARLAPANPASRNFRVQHHGGHPPRGSFTLSTYSYGGVEYSQLDEPKICREGWDGVAVASGRLFPSSLATASEPAILRDFRVVQINVYPC